MSCPRPPPPNILAPHLFSPLDTRLPPNPLAFQFSGHVLVFEALHPFWGGSITLAATDRGVGCGATSAPGAAADVSSAVAAGAKSPHPKLCAKEEGEESEEEGSMDDDAKADAGTDAAANAGVGAVRRLSWVSGMVEQAPTGTIGEWRLQVTTEGALENGGGGGGSGGAVVSATLSFAWPSRDQWGRETFDVVQHSSVPPASASDPSAVGSGGESSGGGGGGGWWSVDGLSKPSQSSGVRKKVCLSLRSATVCKAVIKAVNSSGEESGEGSGEESGGRSGDCVAWGCGPGHGEDVAAEAIDSLPFELTAEEKLYLRLPVDAAAEGFTSTASWAAAAAAANTGEGPAAKAEEEGEVTEEEEEDGEESYEEAGGEAEDAWGKKRRRGCGGGAGGAGGFGGADGSGAALKRPRASSSGAASSEAGAEAECSEEDEIEGGDEGAAEQYDEPLSSSSLSPSSSLSLPSVLVGVDCEMCYTALGLEVTRVSLVNVHGDAIYDSLVTPPRPITDYNTAFSGTIHYLFN